MDLIVVLNGSLYPCESTAYPVSKTGSCAIMVEMRHLTPLSRTGMRRISSYSFSAGARFNIYPQSKKEGARPL